MENNDQQKASKNLNEMSAYRSVILIDKWHPNNIFFPHLVNEKENFVLDLKNVKVF